MDQTDIETDCDLLVREMRSRPALWDTECMQSSDMDIVQEHLWAQVASACSLPVEVVKLKWKKLKEEACQERTELQSEGPSHVDSQGLPYRRLLLLEPQAQPDSSSATPQTPYSTVPLGAKTGEVEEKPSVNGNGSLLNDIRKFLRPLQTTIVTKGRVGRSDGGERGRVCKPTRTGERRRAMNRDETEMYLASLVISVGRLPPPRRQRVLSKIRDIVVSESKRVYVESLRNS